MLRKRLLLFAGVAALMFAACSGDDEVKDPETPDTPEVPGEEEVVDNGSTTTLELMTGSSQSGRITSIGSSSRAYNKKQKLMWVANIKNPTVQDDDRNWSATSVWVDPTTKKVYVTWHSDRQASDPAQSWGGAIDVVDITDEDAPSIESTAISDMQKYNNLLITDGQLFAAGASAKYAAVVARVGLSSGSFTVGEDNNVTADVIGFPGSSVNALASIGDNVYAISGYTGTEGTFAKTIAGTDFTGTDIYAGITAEPSSAEYGGKYVTVDPVTNKAYTLYQPGTANGELKDLSSGTSYELDVQLLSSKKWTESYEYENGTWVVETGDYLPYYGKHVMAVYNGRAYVGAGSSGLRAYDVATGKCICGNSNNTIGVCTDGKFVYASTGIGLRVYEIGEDGVLTLYAMEVETYDEEGGTGLPTSKQNAETGTEARHSPNFVAINPESKYIYVAYGQSGVRVYKFRPEEEPETPEEETDADIYYAPDEMTVYNPIDIEFE